MRQAWARTLVVVAGLAAALPAAAETNANGQDGGLQGQVDAGIGLIPDYVGASAYVLTPYLEGQLNQGNYFLRFEGGALMFNLIDDGAIHAGPLIGYRRGRGDVADLAVSRLRHIRFSIETGGFVEYEHLAADPRSGERVTLSVADGVFNYQSGWDAMLRASLHRPLAFIDQGLIASLEGDVTWGSESYMQTYFGIDAPDAAASGLPVFQAGAGLQSLGVAVALDQFLSRNWSVGLRLHYGRLTGDAAKSPVTAIAGSPNQYFGGVVVGYVL